MKTLLRLCGSAACLVGTAIPALAATAHNSQAGSWGPNSHQCAPTPYFPAGGCASAALIDDRRYPFTVGAEAPARPGRLVEPGAPALPPATGGD